MKLSIIIVSYNTRKLTLECLESIKSELSRDSKLKKETEILIVDNNSPDDSAAHIRAFCLKNSNFKLTVNKENTGFAAANNKALKQAKGDFLLLLNSDTLLQKNALQKLLEAFEKNPVNEKTAHTQRSAHKLDRLGLISAQLFNTDGSPQAQGGDLPTLWSVAGQFFMADDLPLIGKLFPSTQHTGWNAQHQPGSKQNIKLMGWVAATALLVRREVFEEIGYLDEGIFMYGEDVELCLRAQHHHWDCGVASLAKITHYGSASAGSKNAAIGEIKGYVYIWSKHYPAWQTPILKLILKIGCSLRVLLFATIARNPQRRSWYQEAFNILKTL